jgi:ATP-dependent helicase/nuclease subunit A
MSAVKVFAPTSQQLDASNPNHSVWVSANAGSGKTHVLVERVVRLLLEGADPASILCITYTKAAAAEMAGRLFKRLGEWTGLGDAELASALTLMGVDGADPMIRIRARRLFTLALETPGGLKIQTIHAFCDRLLHLFPVEAGIAPGFRVMDERAAKALQEAATLSVLRAAESGQSGPLTASFARLANRVNKEQFDSLIRQLVSKLKTHGPNIIAMGREGYELLVKDALALGTSQSIEDVCAEITNIDRAAYLHHAELLTQYGKHNGINPSDLMKSIAVVQEPLDLMVSYFTVADAKKKRAASGLMSKKVSDALPSTKAFAEQEQERFFNLLMRKNTVEVIAASADGVELAGAILAHIDSEKHRLGLYDFSDLISKAAQLLSSRETTQWVLYKLDAGLSHILVDEAQDTSPDQWRIVRALAEEFFAGEGKPRAIPRTLFVVGDQKQSIFGFQGADTAAYTQARRDLAMPQSGAVLLKPVELAISYRSAAGILAAVDKVFPPADLALIGMGDSAERAHTASRQKAEAIVELWPLTELEDEDDGEEAWTKPVDRPPQSSPQRQLARRLAQTIANWLSPTTPRKLSGEDRAVRADDILILFQSRGPLYRMVLAELNHLRLPVAGTDRLELLQSLIVQDLLALLNFLLLPQDDHALAVVLKSPLVPKPVTEDELFALCHERPSRLIHRLTGKNAAYLQSLQARAQSETPFVLLSHIINTARRNIKVRLGPEAIEAADAMLDMALDHERDHGASLFGFVRWFSDTETTLKREMEEGTGAIRLMTVHGAKGLEAKIVVLADTTKSSAKPGDMPRVITVPEGKGAGLPLWLPSGLGAVEKKLEDWIEGEKGLQQNERNRLLYVAMTRAADELYILGTKPKKSGPPKDCWWNTISIALGEPEGDKPLRCGPADQTTAPEEQQQRIQSVLPSWVSETPQSERTLRPLPLTSLAHGEGTYGEEASRRGRAIHELLEELAEASPQARAALAERRSLRLGVALEEALALAKALAHPDLQPFLGPGSAAEVEISGTLLDGEEVSGRLDRLAVTPEHIWLLDYKTDRSAPESLLPTHAYAQQLARYAALLREAYPDRPVTAAIFWTTPGRLEFLPENLLTAALHKGDAQVP